MGSVATVSFEVSHEFPIRPSLVSDSGQGVRFDLCWFLNRFSCGFRRVFIRFLIRYLVSDSRFAEFRFVCPLLSESFPCGFRFEFLVSDSVLLVCDLGCPIRVSTLPQGWVTPVMTCSLVFDDARRACSWKQRDRHHTLTHTYRKLMGGPTSSNLNRTPLLPFLPQLSRERINVSG